MEPPPKTPVREAYLPLIRIFKMCIVRSGPVSKISLKIGQIYPNMMHERLMKPYRSIDPIDGNPLALPSSRLFLHGESKGEEER